MRKLAVEDEFIALRAQIDRHFPPEKDECERVAVLQPIGQHTDGNSGYFINYLGLAIKEELIRVHAIYNGGSEVRKDMENHRRLVRISEEDLLNDIEDCGDNDRRQKPDYNLICDAQLSELT